MPLGFSKAEGVVQSRRGSGVFVMDGTSPFSRKEKNRILNERIDALLVEAHQLDVGLDMLVNMLRQRFLKYQDDSKANQEDA